MPQINVTIDDINPLITYGPPGAWQEVDPDGDDLSPHYFDQTRTGTPVLGATASFQFYGSAVWLFGAKRDDHGIYNVTLDGTTTSLNGTGNELYQTPIFTATGLALGNHSVTLINAQVNDSFPWVDLDYIMWQTEIGQTTDTLISAVIEDAEPAFVYQPQGAWNTNPPGVSSFSNGSGHGTITDGAYVTFTFAADAVELFGSVGTAMSNYSVQLDNGAPVMYNANRLSNYEKVPLFFATDLSAGNHTLKIVNVPTSTGLGLSIDYASISGTTTSPPSANTTISVPSKTTKHGLSTGVIVAIAVSAGVALLLFIVAFVVLRRRRRRGAINDYSDEDLRRIPVPYTVPLVDQSQLPGMQVTPLALLHDFEQRPFSVGSGPSSGMSDGTSSPGFAGAFRPLLKSSGPSAISLGSQLRSDSTPSQPPASPQVNAADRHRDAGVSLAGHQLPPPDYKEATHSWAPSG